MSNQVLRVQALISSVWRTIAFETVDVMSSPHQQQMELVEKFASRESVVVNTTLIFPREFAAMRVLIEDAEE